jgi:RNA polymerase sigma-70 factor (ECF subfamily)
LHPDESKWLAAAQQGDAQAFSRLVDMYAKPVHNLCYRMLGNTQDAEDAAQEAFMRAFKAVRRVDPERKFLTWLLSVAAHHCIDQYRRVHLPTVSYDEALPGALADKYNGPDVQLERRQTRDQLQNLLASLDPRDRAAIILFYWHDLPYEEIARELSLSESALKSRLHRARRELAAAWQQTQVRPLRGERKIHERPAF